MTLGNGLLDLSFLIHERRRLGFIISESPLTSMRKNSVKSQGMFLFLSVDVLCSHGECGEGIGSLVIWADLPGLCASLIIIN